MKTRRKNTALVAGVASGAVLMALLTAMVFALDTGAAGAVLTVLIIAVSVFIGWIMGFNHRTEERNRHSYAMGYQKGAAENMLVVKLSGHGIRERMKDSCNVL